MSPLPLFIFNTPGRRRPGSRTTTLDAGVNCLRGAKAFGVLRATGVPGAGVVSEGGAAIA